MDELPSTSFVNTYGLYRDNRFVPFTKFANLRASPKIGFTPPNHLVILSPMSLESQLQQAADDGKLLESSLKNIQSLFAGSVNPVYRASVEELANAGEWTELNDRFYAALKFGTGGLRGRTIGKSVATQPLMHAPSTPAWAPTR
jgi:hypothetical protein